MREKITLLLIVILAQIAFVSAAISSPIEVKLTDENGNIISNAEVKVAIEFAGTTNTWDYSYDSSKEKYTFPERTFNDNALIIVSATASGYSTNSVTQRIDTECAGCEIVTITLELESTGEENYLVDEELINTGDCQTSYTQTNSFTDAEGKTIKHCILKSQFVSGNQYVADSYIQEYNVNDPCFDKIGQGYVKQGATFKTEDQREYHLCVKKTAVSTGEQIIKEAKIETQSSCSSGLEQSTNPINLTSSTKLVHCLQTENKQTITSSDDCVINEAFFSTEGRTPHITDYYIGQENPTLYLFVYTNLACENEEIDLDIFIDGAAKNTYSTISSSPETSQNRIVWWYELSAGPSWPTQAPGSPIESVEYKFKARVHNKDYINKESEILTIHKESTTTPAGDCKLENPRWLNSAGAILTEDTIVKGWNFENSEYGSGDYVNLRVDGNDACIAEGAEITFKIFEKDPFFDDEVSAIGFRKIFFYERWQPPWIVPSFINPEFGNFEYYFIAEVEGTEIQSEPSGILNVKEPNPSGFCEDDEECKEQGENFICKNNGCIDSTITDCKLENPRWYNSEGEETTGPVDGWEKESDLDNEELIVALVVDKSETYSGACDEAQINFEVYELDGGTAISPPKRDKETGNLPTIVTAKEFGEETITALEDFTGLSRNEIIAAYWVPRMFKESTDTKSPDNPRYQFKAKIPDKDYETEYSPTLQVGETRTGGGLSGSLTGEGGGNFISDIFGWIGGIFGF